MSGQIKLNGLKLFRINENDKWPGIPPNSKIKYIQIIKLGWSTFYSWNWGWHVNYISMPI